MWSYTNQEELYHYGVPGMKWGHRKAQDRYISSGRAKRNAQAAAKEAYRQSKVNDRAAGLRGIRSMGTVRKNAQAAKQKAYNDSIANDNAHNERLKAQKAAAKQAKKNANAAEDRRIMDARAKQEAIKKEAGKNVKDLALATIGGDKKTKVASTRALSKLANDYISNKKVADSATSGERKASAILAGAFATVYVGRLAARALR